MIIITEINADAVYMVNPFESQTQHRLPVFMNRAAVIYTFSYIYFANKILTTTDGNNNNSQYTNGKQAHRSIWNPINRANNIFYVGRRLGS